jgi:hypothetical protein
MYPIKFVLDNLGITLDYLKFEFVSAVGTDQVLTSTIEVYPNRFSDLLNISIQNEEIKQVLIVDMSSSILKEAKYNHLENLNNLPTGIYIADTNQYWKIFL